MLPPNLQFAELRIEETGTGPLQWFYRTSDHVGLGSENEAKRQAYLGMTSSHIDRTSNLSRKRKAVPNGVLDLEALLYFNFGSWKYLLKMTRHRLLPLNQKIRQRKPKKKSIKGTTSRWRQVRDERARNTKHTLVHAKSLSLHENYAI